ncbi:hypothetical protein HHL16_07530 [Pseudoflavitalea sp. G-6-1-2]|uniref:hypothetical protein n=1 Tax=Pseudoflavitalea sp. G-6-1-2 TaxID=2728841 RepID=UPI00146BB23D|nr:hypothetical protein [Pseudoflavitalea sp. G-6-1-2]NML20719.1 hypothetical protein [Pseudoflavitalea sp. G-6-1-2]
MKLLIAAIIITTLVPEIAVSQDSLVQNLLFTPVYKKKDVFGEEDFSPRKEKSFYLYRNCVYTINPTYGGRRIVRITDIRNDSIYYESYTKHTVVGMYRDTIFRIHPSEIGSISRSNTAGKEIFTTIYLSKYRQTFTLDKAPKQFPSRTAIMQNADSMGTEEVALLPYFSDHGIDLLFEKCGEFFYYDSTSTLDCNTGRHLFPPPSAHIQRRDVIWFTPSNASFISGVNLGLQTLGLNEGDSLTISGVNLSADVLSAVFTMYVLFGTPKSTRKLAEMSDTIPWDEMKESIKGVSLSGGGLVGNADMRGVAINGLLCYVTRSRGLNITGLRNESARFEGVVVSGLINKNVEGRGVQIGLVNRCKHLRGFQFGLWNENSKRSLPFINWDFD